jgi:hypothetical protein
MRPIARLTAALLLALGSAWVPLESALACSCGFPGYPQAIADADVAFVGTLVAEREPLPGGDGFAEAQYAFEVTRARDPMTSPFEVNALFGGDANCGFDMSAGEEWLVIATSQEGKPTTSLCSGTARTKDLDAETRLVVDAMLGTDVATAPTDPGPPTIPVPVLVAGAGVVLVAGLSVLAFRRADG